MVLSQPDLLGRYVCFTTTRTRTTSHLSISTTSKLKLKLPCHWWSASSDIWTAERMSRSEESQWSRVPSLSITNMVNCLECCSSAVRHVFLWFSYDRKSLIVDMFVFFSSRRSGLLSQSNWLPWPRWLLFWSFHCYQAVWWGHCGCWCRWRSMSSGTVTAECLQRMSPCG